MDIERQYLNTLKKVLDEGVRTSNRTGVDALSIFGVNFRHDLTTGFPAMTVRKLAFKSMFHELIWLLKGDSNIGYLQSNGIKIWDFWADSEGNIGPSYPTQWRHFPKPGGGEVDQIAKVIDSLSNNPTSRRHIVCAWNPGMTEEMVLPPCHSFFAFYADDGRLSCHLTQRSGDLPVGVYFNIASYSLLTHLIAQVVGLPVGVFHHTIINAHIYTNQIEGVHELLSRSPLDLPELWINQNIKSLDDIMVEDACLLNYKVAGPQINFPVAV